MAEIKSNIDGAVVTPRAGKIRVLRIIEYTYDSFADYEHDSKKWTMNRTPSSGMAMRSVAFMPDSMPAILSLPIAPSRVEASTDLCTRCGKFRTKHTQTASSPAGFCWAGRTETFTLEPTP